MDNHRNYINLLFEVAGVKDWRSFTKKRTARLRKEKQRREEIKRVLNKIRYCKVCSKPYKVKSTYTGGRKFCDRCHDLWKNKQRDPKVAFICEFCDQPFHPIRNWPYQKDIAGRFCSVEHYWKWRK